MKTLSILKTVSRAAAISILLISFGCSKKVSLYQTFDQQQAIRIVSSDQLELRHGETILLCKYSRQGASLRVVLTEMGTDKVLYFQPTDKGFTDNEGTVFERVVSGTPVIAHPYFAKCVLEIHNPDQGFSIFNKPQGADLKMFPRYLPQNDASINISPIKNTDFVEITVKAADPTIAVNRANELAETIQRKSIEDQKQIQSHALAELEAEVSKQRKNVETLPTENARIRARISLQNAEARLSTQKVQLRMSPQPVKILQRAEAAGQ